ncbi:uncharacterized protein NECHADRAFT_85393 [Fusarium vanettenii 77-13-4]|uniref:Uncharacterized protein n=1 Tax=Fusarium vanettenii (strain ATCC MYA-4622 / CBS 123669 / FGSC 9596 / NRRL 45880 / 77-13-4) TaxID=660122 RepID=C7ZJ85_FUSV7|nr:uncharacterized protein NECHADRAFT_85393 [Fusarium vanettenii 77-13-4]EEU35970.1 predicted protein [Fusarium vanettenii 77-13-4]
MIQPSLEINRALMPFGNCTQNGTWQSRDGTTECLRESQLHDDPQVTDFSDSRTGAIWSFQPRRLETTARFDQYAKSPQPDQTQYAKPTTRSRPNMQKANNMGSDQYKIQQPGFPARQPPRGCLGRVENTIFFHNCRCASA